MKAYILGMRSDPDEGNEIVFADTVREAKKQAIGMDFYESSGDWLDLYANRYKKYDDLEHLTRKELALHQWRDGWWWHEPGYPDPDEGTDQDFYKWYDSTFGEIKK